MATTAMTPAPSRLPAPMVQELRSIMANVPALLPPDIPFEQFRAGLWLELQQQEKLAECTPASLVTAVIKAANAGLLPGRDCHLLPFRNRGHYEVTHIPNYQGIVLALERSGKLRKAFAHAVYSNDAFTVDYLQDLFSHKPHLNSQRGTLVCFYGCILLKDGTRHIEIMTLEQIDAIRRRAPGHDSGPWATDYEEMARKTALKRVAKRVRLTPQQHQLLDDDDARELTDPAPERFRENVSDLYGDERNVPNFAREQGKVATAPHGEPIDTSPPLPGDSETKNEADARALLEEGEAILDGIDAIMRAHGETTEAIAAWWTKTCKRCQVPMPSALSLRWLEKLLEEREQYYATRAASTSAPMLAVDEDDAEALAAARQAFD